MSGNRLTSFAEAAGYGLVSVALRLGQTPSQRKRNILTLYEAGAISGGVAQFAIKKMKLEAA